MSVITDRVKVEQNCWPCPRPNARRQLSALHLGRGQDGVLEMSEEVDSSKLEELDKEADGTKVPKGGRYEGLADSMEELSAGRLRPGQSVTFGLHEVMVIKVVERTVIVEGAAVS